MNLLQWAAKWRVPPEALRDLANTVDTVTVDTNQPEGHVQQQQWLGAARSGRLLWRNNRGAGKMASGTFVRYGLANVSKAQGDATKSGDLIGIDPVLITPEMVGCVIGRFMSLESKREDWKFSGTLNEMAQIHWKMLVESKGGIAIISNDARIFG